MEPAVPEMTTTPIAPSLRAVGDHIREWRQRRRYSQLECALEAQISQKHLSFIESGRSTPSRDMVLRIATALDVPLRERNAMILAAGFAPVYPERAIDDPALAPARAAIDLILKGHGPYPALAVDRAWTLIAANDAVGRLLTLVADPALLQPPVNVLRLSLSPGGLQPHIVNIGQWRGHVLERLRQQASATGDDRLRRLHNSLAAIPVPAGTEDHPPAFGGIAVPLQIRVGGQVLSLISTVTVFGTPVDVTLSELALETFYPANPETDSALRALAGQ